MECGSHAAAFRSEAMLRGRASMARQKQSASMACALHAIDSERKQAFTGSALSSSKRFGKKVLHVRFIGSKGRGLAEIVNTSLIWTGSGSGARAAYHRKMTFPQKMLYNAAFAS
jgi:hypothetical protein